MPSEDFTLWSVPSSWGVPDGSTPRRLESGGVLGVQTVVHELDPRVVPSFGPPPVSSYELGMLMGSDSCGLNRPVTIPTLLHVVRSLYNDAVPSLKRLRVDLANPDLTPEERGVLGVQADAARLVVSSIESFAEDISKAKSERRDLDASQEPEPGLDLLRNARKSEPQPAYEPQMIHRDLVRVRDILGRVRKACIKKTCRGLRRRGISGTLRVSRLDVPLTYGTLVLGISGEVPMRLTTVEELALDDALRSGRGCYPEPESESDADDDDAADFEGPPTLRAGSGSSVFEKFRRDVMLREVASLGKTSKTTSTGMLKLSPQLLDIVRSYASSPGFPPGSFVSEPVSEKGASIQHVVRLGGWDAAMRAGLVATVKSF